jgi:hypothetical protein
MAKGIKNRNPVAICWGLVLRKSRESRSWEYTDIERMSGISQDFYRNIEKAIFNLHVSQALPLYLTFKNEVIGSTFSLDGIIQILSVISIMEASANERVRKYEHSSDDSVSIYYSALEECAENLAENSFKLKKLFFKFFEANVFSLENDTDSMVVKIEEAGLVYELENFLIQYQYYGEETEAKYKLDYIDNFFANVPSIYTDFISETKRNLLSLPVKMIFSELQNWERRNESKIEELFVLITAKFDVTEQNNLEHYHYSYLFKNNFKRARFLVIHKDFNRDVKQDFEDNLEKAYKSQKIKIPKNWKEGLSKIQFKVLPDLPDSLLKILTVKDELNKEIQYECFWVFKFVDETLVAFVASAEEAEDFDKTNRYIFNEGRSLFIKDIITRYPVLKEYFNS